MASHKCCAWRQSKLVTTDDNGAVGNGKCGNGATCGDVDQANVSGACSHALGKCSHDRLTSSQETVVFWVKDFERGGQGVKGQFSQN